MLSHGRAPGTGRSADAAASPYRGCVQSRGGWARESRALAHRRFTQELSRAGPRTLLRHIYITMAFSGTREGKGQGFELGTSICAHRA